MIKSDGLPLGWELTQYADQGSGVGFKMWDILSTVDTNEYTAVCYGPSIQGPQAADTFLIAALRGTKVKNPSTRVCEPAHRFTPMLHHTGCIMENLLDDGDDGFEEIIGPNPNGLNFVIPNFTPHCVRAEGEPCDGCKANVVCPNTG